MISKNELLFNSIFNLVKFLIWPKFLKQDIADSAVMKDKINMPLKSADKYAENIPINDIKAKLIGNDRANLSRREYMYLNSSKESNE